MTRESIEKVLGKDADKEVISDLLNLFHTELDKEKEKTQIEIDKANQLNEQLDKANKTIKALEKNATDEEAVKAEIDGYKNQILELEERNQKDKINFAIESALKEAKAIDPEFAKVGLDMERVRLEKDGSVSGIDEQIKILKKEKSFLFEQEPQKPKMPNYEPRTGKSRIDKNNDIGKQMAQYFSDENKKGFSIKGEN